MCKMNAKKYLLYESKAIAIVSLLQMLLLFILAECVIVILHHNSVTFVFNPKLNLCLAIAGCVIIWFINDRRYEGKYESYLVKWEHESRFQNAIRGYLIVTLYILVLVSLYLVPLILKRLLMH